MYLPPQISGPCNSFHCLGHFKNVCDDDDDDAVDMDATLKKDASSTSVLMEVQDAGWRSRTLDGGPGR